jgi:hypothetical protein
MGRGCGIHAVKLLLVVFAIGLAGWAGCSPPATTRAPEKQGNTGIFGKTTQEIGEFKPEEGAKVSDSSIDEDQLATPLIGAAAAYGPLTEQVSKLAIQQALNFFYASEGRYPKDHDEFMARIIRPDDPDGIKLPALRAGRDYQYDVENHELLVVEKKESDN